MFMPCEMLMGLLGVWMETQDPDGVLSAIKLCILEVRPWEAPQAGGWQEVGSELPGV